MYLDSDADLRNWIKTELTTDQRQKIEPLLKADASERRSLDRLITARRFVCPSLALANRVAQNNHNKVFVYQFDRIRPGIVAKTMGAYHGAELPYTFDTHDTWLPTDDKDRELTLKIQRFWANFIKTGNPNDEQGQTEWPRFNSGHPVILTLDTNPDIKSHSSQELCAILESD